MTLLVLPFLILSFLVLSPFWYEPLVHCNGEWHGRIFLQIKFVLYKIHLIGLYQSARYSSVSRSSSFATPELKLKSLSLSNATSNRLRYSLLTHFSPVSHFYTPWKCQKTFGLFHGLSSFYENKNWILWVSGTIRNCL